METAKLAFVALSCAGCTTQPAARFAPVDLAVPDASTEASVAGAPVPSRVGAALGALGLDLDHLPALADVPDDVLPGVMSLISSAVGAACPDCHVADPAVNTPRKRVARRMWDDMTRGFTLPDGQALFCDSCHQGQLTFLDRGSDDTLSRWMQVAFVDGLRPRDGGPQSCAACHGSPFVPGFLDGWAADDAAPVDAGPPPVCRPVINEVQTAGASGAGDEFIELYNPCGAAVPLGGYTLVYRSAAGVVDVLLHAFSVEQLAPQGRLVVGSAGYPGAAAVRYPGGLSSSGGGVALRGPIGDLVDTVTWGQATNVFVIGHPGATPPPGQSLARVPDGSHATGDQSLDLRVGSPTPDAANP